jgi:lactoylglutathione lyase
MPLEHVNYTVTDPIATATLLCEIFDWKIRWQGESMSSGQSVHVGEKDSYLALYNPNKNLSEATNSYSQKGGLNHIGVVVDDLDATEAKVKAQGYIPHQYGDYEPGRRFYFDGPDGIEIEVVSYA